MSFPVGRGWFSSLTAGAAVLGALMFAVPQAAAQPASLEGSWSGGGVVIFPSGDRESARCRATFRRAGTGFGMNAVCATASARVAQSAQLARISANRFAGEFYNAEYSVSGSITITVRGNHISAALNGGGGSAHFNLSR
ncbi:MAG TPA: hypothetical protein VJ740_14585 [Hyphomicrobiaceae bacterium]|nr:hypothetical protein [Hyphomicrobiaceae bacterium]